MPRNIYDVYTPAGHEREQPFPTDDKGFLPAGYVYSTNAVGVDPYPGPEGLDWGVHAHAYGVVADHNNETHTTSSENSDAVSRWLMGAAASPLGPARFRGGIRMSAHDSMALPILIPPISGALATDDFSIIGGTSSRDFFFLSGELDVPWLQIGDRLGLWTGDVLSQYLPAWDEDEPETVRYPPYPPHGLRTSYYIGFSMFGRGLTNMGDHIIDDFGNDVSLQHGVAWLGRHDKIWGEDIQAYGINGTAWHFGKSQNMRLELATSRAQALTGVSNVNITSVGSGVISVVGERETVRVFSVHTVADSLVLTGPTKIQRGDPVTVSSTVSLPGGIGAGVYYAIPRDTLLTTSGFAYPAPCSIRESNFRKLCAYGCGRAAATPSANYDPADPGHPSIIFSCRGATFGLNFLELEGLEASTWRGVGVLIEYEGVRVSGNRVKPGNNNSHVLNAMSPKFHGTGPIVDPTIPSNDGFFLYESEADFLSGNEGLRINITDYGEGEHVFRRMSDSLEYTVHSTAVNRGHNLLGTPTWHNYRDGDVVRIMSTTGTLPPPLELATDYWVETDPGVLQPSGHTVASGQALVIRGAVGPEINFTKMRITQAAWEDPEQFAVELIGVDYAELTNPVIEEIQYPEHVHLHIAGITTCQNGVRIEGGGNHRVEVTSHAGIRKKIDGAWRTGALLQVEEGVVKPIYFKAERAYEVLVKSAAKASRLVHLEDSKLDPVFAWTEWRTIANTEHFDKNIDNYSTAALDNAAGLGAPIHSTGDYEFLMVFDFLTTPNANLKFSLVGSGITIDADSINFRTRKWAPGATAYTEVDDQTVFPSTVSPDTVTAVSAGYGRIEIHGRMSVTALNDTGYEGLYLRWAQGTAHADVSTSLSGSFMEVRKLA